VTAFPVELSFEDIARIIAAPAGAPPWLPTFLESWAPSLMIDRFVHQMQPPKSKMRQRMEEISAAARVLQQMLHHVPTKEFLENEGHLRFEKAGGLENTLKVIEEGAKVASASLARAAMGTTRSGRGKALPKGAISPKAFCAVIVAEAWAHVHGDYPPRRSKRAAAAAHALWLSAGGMTSSSGSDPLAGWRYHFTEAQSKATKSYREDARRHCIECARLEMRLRDTENNCA
jgi:hypothetical protein